MALPSVYLFYGDNQFSMEQSLDVLRDKLGASADFNLLRLSGSNLDLAALRLACSSLPFLSDRRLIIVEDSQSLPAAKPFKDELTQILDGVPSSTALVFVAQIPADRRNAEADFQKRSAVFAWATAHPKEAFVRSFPSPRGAAFADWLVTRAEQLGGRLDRQAAQLLSDSVNDEVLLGDQELLKLITFADADRPISVADVEQLTPIYGQADIFEAIDALGHGTGSIGKLQRLLEEQDPSYVFLMVVRQFRLMLQARQALDQGTDPLQAMRVPPFVARKLAQQARNFSHATLISFYHRLQQFDLEVKRGKADISLDLIGLVAGLAVAPTNP